MQLARVAVERRELLIPARGHIDYEARLEGIILHVVEYGKRSMGFTVPPANEAGVETTRLDQPMGPAVVRMTILGRRTQDDRRLVPAKDFDQRIFFPGTGSELAVTAVQKLDTLDPQGLTRAFRFDLAFFGGPSRSGFTTSQVEDSNLAPGLRELGQRSTAR